MPSWFKVIDFLWWNFAIFCGFFLVATLHHFIAFKRAPTMRESGGHVLMAAVFSPATFDAVRDFMVHLVVYSGYVLPHP